MSTMITANMSMKVWEAIQKDLENLNKETVAANKNSNSSNNDSEDFINEKKRKAAKCEIPLEKFIKVISNHGVTYSDYQYAETIQLSKLQEFVAELVTKIDPFSYGENCDYKQNLIFHDPRTGFKVTFHVVDYGKKLKGKNNLKGEIEIRPVDTGCIELTYRGGKHIQYIMKPENKILSEEQLMKKYQPVAYKAEKEEKNRKAEEAEAKRKEAIEKKAEEERIKAEATLKENNQED